MELNNNHHISIVHTEKEILWIISCITYAVSCLHGEDAKAITLLMQLVDQENALSQEEVDNMTSKYKKAYEAMLTVRKEC